MTSQEKKIVEDEYLNENNETHTRQYDEDTGEVYYTSELTWTETIVDLCKTLCAATQLGLAKMNPVVMVALLIATYVLCLNVGDPVVNSIDNQGICLLEMRNFNGLTPTFQELELEEIVDRIHKCGRAFDVDTSRLTVASK